MSDPPDDRPPPSAGRPAAQRAARTVRPAPRRRGGAAARRAPDRRRACASRRSWAGRAVLVSRRASPAATLVGPPLGLGVALRAARARRDRGPRAAARWRSPTVDLRVGAAPDGARPLDARVVGARRGARRSCRCCARDLGRRARACSPRSLLASLAASGGRRWGELCRRARRGVGAAAARAGAREPRRRARRVACAAPGPAARGVALAADPAGVFVPLLMSADAAFAELLEDVVPTAGASTLRSARIARRWCS